MRNFPLDSANVKCCDRPQGQPSLNVILFSLQSLSANGLGKSGLVRCYQHRSVAHQSSLITHDRRFLPVWQEIVVNFYLPPQPCKSSKIASKSPKSVFDFLRLAFSLLSRSAAEGKSFSTGADFLFSSRSVRSAASCDRNSITSACELPKSFCNRCFLTCTASSLSLKVPIVAPASFSRAV